jgi:hypothetical protein
MNLVDKPGNVSVASYDAKHMAYTVDTPSLISVVGGAVKGGSGGLVRQTFGTGRQG